MISVVSGEVRASGEGGGTRTPFRRKLTRGDNVLAPFAGAFTFTAETVSILLVTENFVG